MKLHAIRLKAPWLVSLAGTIPLAAETAVQRPAHRELPEQILQLLASSPGPVDVWAVRRFHRPTGLSPAAELSIVIQASRLPDAVFWAPLQAGEQLATGHQRLPRLESPDNRAEYRLPRALPLRSELRLEWTGLEIESAADSISVDLTISDAE